MKRSLLIGATLLLGVACTTENDATPRGDQLAVTRALAESLVHGDFDGATRSFNDEMRGSLGAEKLGENWKSLVERFGSVQALDGVRATEAGEFQIFYVHATCVHGEVDIRVVFKGGTEVGGLWFRPPDATKHYQAMAVALDGLPAEVGAHPGH